MGQTAHLVLRHQTWHWRRRVPSDLQLTSPRGRLSLSLGTGVLRAARRIALLLDLALEELRMHQAPLDPTTLTSILTKIRDDALAADQAERAQLPPDLGFLPHPTASRRIVAPTDLGQRLLRWLAEQGLMTGIDDTDLRDPLKGRGDGFATGGGDNADGSAMVHGAGEMRQSTDGGPVHRGPLLPPDLDHDIRAFIAAHPAPPARMTTARAASDIRATIAQGVQGAFHDAARRNDGAMAQGHVQRIVDNMVAEGHAFQLGDRAVLERHALPVLAAVHEQVASRERKPQPIDLGSPGPMSLPQPANMTPAIPFPCAFTAPVAQVTTSTTPVPTVTEMLKKCIALKKSKGWNDKSIADASTTIRMFVEFRGDAPIDQVTTADAFNFKQLLIGVPKLAGKGRFAGMGIQELVAEADALEQSLNDGQVEPGTIAGVSMDEDDESWHVDRYSITTINKHINFLNVIFKVGMQYLGRKEDHSVFADQFYDKALVREQRRKRPAYEVSELEKLFRTPAWTGCVDDRLRATSSSVPPSRDARFWAPLVAAHQGMRLEECLQLKPEDIGEQEGIPVIRIREGKGQKLKTASSARVVPVHSTLIQLGFLQYAADHRAEGASFLYPELKRGGKFATFGHSFSMWWTDYRRAIGIYEPGKDFHAFRTTVNTQLLRRGVNETSIKSLLGHSTNGDITAQDYNAGLKIDDLRRALELWHFDVNHLIG
ncbi:integrase (plasmid) [Azospirillum sp. B510]|uniref:site-specific integrase n=1 Tax=Azospirillum sp. (strain B510) TaxID=137722 RepID=UPI0001C4BD0A|nr:integrase [Azospirillum sp. B510]